MCSVIINIDILLCSIAVLAEYLIPLSFDACNANCVCFDSTWIDLAWRAGFTYWSFVEHWIMFYLHPTFLYDWIISYCSVKRSWLCFYNILDAQSQIVFSTKRLFKNFTRKELLLFLLRAPFLCVVSNDPNSLSSRFFLTYIWSTATSVLASKKREETMVLRRSSTLKDYLLRVETFSPLPLWVVVCMCFRSCFQ